MKKLLIKTLEAFGAVMVYILPEGFCGALSSMRNRVYTEYQKSKRLPFCNYGIMWRKDALEIIKNKQPEHKILFLRSWNEWGEGNYVEPDLRYGHGYLDALKEELF